MLHSKTYTFPSETNIDEKKKYTIIAETTFSLKSQIVKKSNKFRKSFLSLSLIYKLYLIYPKYVENYYKYFIRKYILREKIEKKLQNQDNELDFSCYGNYAFIIVNNKALIKTFKEAAYLTKTFYFNGNSKDAPDISIKKFFWK